ncbi:hypothetical protein NMG60_11028272 [Bertholletia excelsa]
MKDIEVDAVLAAVSNSAVSCSLRRHHRRRRSSRRSPEPIPSSPTEQKLQMVVDMNNLSNEASLSVRRLWRSTQLSLNQFLHSGNEALEDLQTLITVDADRRVIVSCRRSTLQFVGNLVIWTCVIVIGFRVLANLGLVFWRRLGFGNASGWIRRRDRSLGGREVVVGRKRDMNANLGILKSPLSPARGTLQRAPKTISKNWASGAPPPVISVNKHEYQRMANNLIRAILDYRVHGRDISENDIIQFRRLCRTSGARVFIDTENARDSFYRAAIGLVLNICRSAADQATSVYIDGEDVWHFIAGLAENIGLENTRAARMVSAAVAAQTRSRFLQAWALEMQGKRSEGLMELSKLCCIHRIFPPEENSPEMEMVARGLEKHLKVEQREFLMEMLSGICDKGRPRSLAEALGLCHKHSKRRT